MHFMCLCLQPGDEGEAPRNKKPRPMVENTLEECDAIEEDASFFVFGEDGAVTQRVSHGVSQSGCFSIPRLHHHAKAVKVS